MGALRSLEDFVDEAGGQEYKDLFSDFLINAVTFDGDLYCIPHEGDAFVLYINTRCGKRQAWTLTIRLQPSRNRGGQSGANECSRNWYASACWPNQPSPQSGCRAGSWPTIPTSSRPTTPTPYFDTPKGLRPSRSTPPCTPRMRPCPWPTEVNYGAQVALFAQESRGLYSGPLCDFRFNPSRQIPDLEPYLKCDPVPRHPGDGRARFRCLCFRGIRTSRGSAGTDPVADFSG